MTVKVCKALGWALTALGCALVGACAALAAAGVVGTLWRWVCWAWGL